ncbi:MAG: PD-(D/E)XK nuclease family protein [Proteobacteria bacterium]|nr:PD-(D/E)XK nuclease family protein [Pseudomonadota bacterium]
MPATLVTGPINSGKTSLALKILAGCDPGRTGMVVVPDRATATLLRRRFAAGLSGPLKAMRADSIEDWAGFVRRLAAPALPVATRQHSLLIVLGLLGKMRLSHFGAAARSYSTAESFAGTILALKENLVGPSDLAEIVSGTGETCLRERDLIRVYGEYDRELTGRGLLDEGDLTMLAIRAAIEGAPGLSGMGTIVFDEFAMPSPAQLAMVRALAAGREDAEITITCPSASSDSERPFADWLRRARDAWLSAADGEQRLAPAPAKAPRVRVLKAATPAQEARHAALIVQGEGLRASDFVVAARAQDSFLEWFLSEAHSMDLLPEHPTPDGAMGSPLAHELLSPDSVGRLPSRATPSVFASRMREMAELRRRARPWVAALRERRGRGRVAARSLAAAGIIEESLAALSAAEWATGAITIGREQFAQLFRHDLGLRTARSTMLESVLPFRLHPLGLPLAREAGGVIVPRMTEGSFPARPGETLFFSDWREEAIRRIFPDAEDMHARESYAFETMLEKCTGRITLLFPAVADSGGQTIPSPFVDRFIGTGEAPRPLAPCVLGAGPRGRKGGETDRIIEVELARIAGEEPRESRHGNHMGVLRSRAAREAMRERFTAAEFSPTALERYAECPFAFFAQYALRATEPPEETPQIRPMDRGRVVHEILARYYRDSRLVSRNPGPGTRERGPGIAGNLERSVRKIAEAVWTEQGAGLEYVSPGLREREIDEAAGMALMVIRAEGEEARSISSPLSPCEFEWEFSMAKGNALRIEVKGQGPLYIRGRVDRIDADQKRRMFLVIDYKTGREEQVSGRIESGSHLQLPLYIRAVKGALLADAVPLGGLLMEIREASSSGDGRKTCGKTKGLVLKDFEGKCYRVGGAHSKMDGGRMGALLLSAERKSAEFASSIRQGLFPASDGADCERCDYGDICRHRTVSAD